MNQSKAEIRAEFKEKRNQLTAAELREGSEKIALATAHFCDQHPELKHFHLFLPIQKLKEVNTFLIWDLLVKRNKILYTSIISDSSNQMETVRVDDNTDFVDDRYGIPIPKSFELISPEFIQVVFVPLLAIDQEGQRIGYGKGYYDRFLATVNPKVIKIGLSLFEPISRVPSDSFDVPLDYCITPENLIYFSK